MLRLREVLRLSGLGGGTVGVGFGISAMTHVLKAHARRAERAKDRFRQVEANMACGL
jgi:hypothetical protein